ncbi:MAG: hypothetical protein U1F14_12380 [Steroidobacteraceae bacterium]
MTLVTLVSDRIATAQPGRVARRLERRTKIVYASLCLAGLVPSLLQWSSPLQAAGLGLWFPGAGFLAGGPWGAPAAVATLVFFALALIAWFGAGMVVAPVAVWLLGAVIAGLTAPAVPWPPAPLLVPCLVFGGFLLSRHRAARREAADLEALRVRNDFLPGAIERLHAERSGRPAPGSRELDEDQLQHLRYALDRALQPVQSFAGFDRRDQFQTAATRYQINALAYAIGLAQCHYTPAFHGYVSAAQRNLIAKYLQKPVWNYWAWESMWGHLNFTNHDPVGRDNVMLTGFFGIQVGLYTSNTGDRRYMQPDGLQFVDGDRVVYSHDLQDLARSIVTNFERSEFCLYPCEPNWIYPICNHYGMTALTLADRLNGTANVAAILPHWLHMLETELSDRKGTPLPLRSSLTGWTPPFPATDGMYVPFANCFMPARAERLWATARTEMQALVSRAGDGVPQLRFPGEGIDFGSYRKGHTMNYAQFALAAREMGDDEFAGTCDRGARAAGGFEVVDGIARYATASNLANGHAAFAAMARRDDFRVAVAEGPPASTLAGPLLTDAAYPDVLVAKAFSHTGRDLELVLRPGRTAGAQRIAIGRLWPDTRYALSGDLRGEVTADHEGRAELTVPLNGRTAFTLSPCA